VLHLIKSSYFQTLLESFPGGVIIFNTQGEAYAANAYAAKLIGVSSEECSGINWRSLFEEIENREEYELFMGDAHNPEGGRPSMALKHERSPGDFVYLSLSLSWLIENEKVFGIVMSMTDVSHIVELHEREKQILSEKNKLQKDRVKSLQKLAMAVAHQIRNPVMSMSGLAKLISKKKNADPGVMEYVEGIIDGGMRLEAVVKAVHDFTAIKPKERVPVDVADLLERARSRAREIVPVNGTQVSWKIEGDACPAESDPDLLGDVLVEVLSNSLESFDKREEGRIDILLHRDWKGCLVEVRDDGHGIAEDDKPYIFDPFFSTKPKNVGMGLTKSQRILQELGGEISVESTQGEGTIVKVWY
jgi:PAS domain S-box-containing protein